MGNRSEEKRWLGEVVPVPKECNRDWNIQMVMKLMQKKSFIWIRHDIVKNPYCHAVPAHWSRSRTSWEVDSKLLSPVLLLGAKLWRNRSTVPRWSHNAVSQEGLSLHVFNHGWSFLGSMIWPNYGPSYGRLYRESLIFKARSWRLVVIISIYNSRLIDYKLLIHTEWSIL